MKRNAAALFIAATKGRSHKMKRIIAAAIIAMTASVAWSHSGGTDAAGCHYNHKTGQYHCH